MGNSRVVFDARWSITLTRVSGVCRPSALLNLSIELNGAEVQLRIRLTGDGSARLLAHHLTPHWIYVKDAVTGTNTLRRTAGTPSSIRANRTHSFAPHTISAPAPKGIDGICLIYNRPRPTSMRAVVWTSACPTRVTSVDHWGSFRSRFLALFYSSLGLRSP